MPAVRLTPADIAALERRPGVVVRRAGGAATPTRRTKRPVALATPAWAIRLVVPVVTRSEANERHWRQRSRRTKECHAATGAVLHAAGLATFRPPLPCRVTLTRLGKRLLDTGDNLNVSCKSVRDFIAAWIGVDDADGRVTWAYDQRVTKGGYGVEVTVSGVLA